MCWGTTWGGLFGVWCGLSANTAGLQPCASKTTPAIARALLFACALRAYTAQDAGCCSHCASGHTPGRARALRAGENKEHAKRQACIHVVLILQSGPNSGGVRSSIQNEVDYQGSPGPCVQRRSQALSATKIICNEAKHDGHAGASERVGQ